ncbi:MAG: signal peptidase I [Cellulosilyticaceae bacterium]
MKAKREKRLKTLHGWIKDILIASLIVIVLTQFGFQNLKVVGSSMAPTLLSGQLVIINKIAYRLTEPKLGDVIGFYTPGIREKVVKRIIGMPGDVIDYKEGILYVNQKAIQNLTQEKLRKRGDIEYPYQIPNHSYFVVGDNLNSSIDSRYKSIGCITKEQIIGKISLRVWPFWVNPLID